MAQLLLFGVLADIAGTRAEIVEASSIGELLEAAIRRFGESFEKALPHCTIAVDGVALEEVDNEARIGSDSEVALLPPVSGGSSTGAPEPAPIRMADVSEKPKTKRSATARCRVVASPPTVDAVLSGQLPKGDVLSAARLAGIMGAKLTPQIVPLCHPVSIASVAVEITREGSEALSIVVAVEGEDRTGFEMEALCGAAAAALTIYDMSKSQEPGVRIEELRLLSKSGGKSGEWVSDE